MDTGVGQSRPQRLFASPAIFLLIPERIFNPVFFVRIGWGPEPAGDGTLLLVTVFIIGLIAIWDVFDVVRKARHDPANHAKHVVSTGSKEWAGTSGLASRLVVTRSRKTLNSTRMCVAYVQSTLAEQTNPEKAKGMQAYMKTEMPFYGVQKPARSEILRHIKREFAPANREEYEDLVTAVWQLPHREEKYLAQGIAAAFRQFIVPDSLPIYERFIDEGAWWDFVDEAATHMIRRLVLNYPNQTWPVVDTWIGDDNMWRRRAAIICQIGAKERTDTERLFAFCAARAHEREFFMRKAIGWALREYAKTDPEAVAAFVNTHEEELSALSYREASKHIRDLVR